MARPLRIEFAGALYHVTARGNEQKAIYESDANRRQFLEILGEVCDRCNWSIHAYCLMGNHYHLLAETPDGNLSRGMRQLNGVYTQRFNKAHARVGHVFQGRYKAILVQKEAHLLELARYIVLNPVRARVVRAAGAWPWSSYRATIGRIEAQSWLDTDWTLSSFSRRKGTAIESYEEFVRAGRNQPSPWEQLKNQVFLGSEAFVASMRQHVDPDAKLDEVPKVQRQGPVEPLSYFAQRFPERNEAMSEAYRSGAYTLEEIGRHFGLHYSTVSRIVASGRHAK